MEKDNSRKPAKNTDNFSSFITIALGGGIGWAFLGPIGAILGAVIGSLFETDMLEQKDPYGPTTQGDFSASMAILISAVLQANGRVMKSELNYVKDFLRKNFGTEKAREMLLFIRDLTKQYIPVEDVSIQIKNNMDYSSRLQLLYFLYGIAQADGTIESSEVRIIHYIANYMGITEEDIRSVFSTYFSPKDDLDACYKVLEIDRNATNEEVKKAYRRMANRYHPDKVSHLSKEVYDSANEKFQKVNDAYQRIKKARGMK